MPVKVAFTLALLAAAAPHRMTAQQLFPIEAPVTSRLFEAWVNPLPSPVRLFLQLAGTETYPSDTSCMATEVQTTDLTMRVVILGRQVCAAGPRGGSRDGESVPFKLLPMRISGRYVLTIVHAGDSTVVVLGGDRMGYAVTAQHIGPTVAVPPAIPAISPNEAIVSCVVADPKVDSCNAYFQLLLVRGRLHFGHDLAAYMKAYSFPPYYSLSSRVDSASVRNQRLYGIVDSASLGRMIAYTEEYARTMIGEGDRPTVRMQITTGRGLRYMCSPRCEKTVLKNSMDGTSIWFFDKEP